MKVEIYTLNKEKDSKNAKGYDLNFFKEANLMNLEESPPELLVGVNYDLKDSFELNDRFISMEDVQEALEEIYKAYKEINPIVISDVIALGERYFFCDDEDFKEVVI